MPRQKRSVGSIGLISDDPILLAERVHAQLAYGDRIVWACERGYVYAMDPDLAGVVAPHSIAGTFRLGESFDALADDLKCLRDSLVKDWILDEGDSSIEQAHTPARR
jgi:hypothetical protein